MLISIITACNGVVFAQAQIGSKLQWQTKGRVVGQSESEFVPAKNQTNCSRQQLVCRMENRRMTMRFEAPPTPTQRYQVFHQPVGIAAIAHKAAEIFGFLSYTPDIVTATLLLECSGRRINCYVCLSVQWYLLAQC
jgi:hypothetical protein